MSTLSFSCCSSDVFRVDTNGQYRWVANLGLDATGEMPLAYPANDEGALVASYFSNALVRIDPAGDVSWTLGIPAQWIAGLPGTDVAVGSCKQLTALDGDSGHVHWQIRPAGATPRCKMTALLADEHGNLFATQLNDSLSDTGGSRLLKIGADGQQLWLHEVDGEGARLFGIDSGRAYLATPTRLIAVDVTSGLQIWQSTVLPTQTLFVPGSPAMLVAVAADAVSGIATDDGIVQWTQPIAVSGVAEAIGNAVLVNTSSGLVKLDAVNGTIAWTTPLPSSDSFGHVIAEWLAFGGLMDGQFLAIGRADALMAQPPPVVRKIDFLSGHLVADLPLPAIVQGTFPASHFAAGQVTTLGVEPDAAFARYRLRSIDAASGADLWSRLELPFDSSLVNSSYGPNFQIAVDNEMIAASIGEGGLPRSDVAVLAWQLDDGDRLWQTGLRPPGDGWFDSRTSAPLIDSESDVLLSLATRVECLPPDYCGRTALYKLDGGDGSINWQYVQDYAWQGGIDPILFIPIFVETSGDVIAVGRGNTLVRLDGADGSVEWTADTTAIGRISSLQVAADGNPIATGFDRWGKFDAATGSLLWSGVAPIRTCAPDYCTDFGTTLLLAGGYLLQTGYKRVNSAQVTPMVALMHADGTGSSEVWFPDEGSTFSSQIVGVDTDTGQEIWMEFRERELESPFNLYFLTKFDLDTGSFQGRQALGITSYNPLTDSQVSYQYFGAPVADRLLALNYTRQTPMPATRGLALIDTTVTAHGNLSIAAILPDGPVASGHVVPFSVNVDYSGEALADSVQVALSLPWSGEISGLSCQAEEPGSCEFNNSNGDIRATFPISPNGMVSIQGEVQVLDGDDPAPAMIAVVQGPTALLESDSADNVAVVRVEQSLFDDGFDISASR
ncbi:PQQ-binding-like beta-propeller repeat protein [Dokdonella sp.]|uniref:outer membrane protein assembly factor BamB family protein n=1 Tax=Dokdonella sp. TaxID=2291710 RepID=UPI003C419B46